MQLAISKRHRLGDIMGPAPGAPSHRGAGSRSPSTRFHNHPGGGADFTRPGYCSGAACGDDQRRMPTGDRCRSTGAETLRFKGHHRPNSSHDYADFADLGRYDGT